MKGAQGSASSLRLWMIVDKYAILSHLCQGTRPSPKLDHTQGVANLHTAVNRFVTVLGRDQLQFYVMLEMFVMSNPFLEIFGQHYWLCMCFCKWFAK